MDAESAAAVRELYVRSYPRLVAVVAAILMDAAEAEESVQEAFVRLIANWEKVSAFDDPEAWVRMVAVRVASNRLRKMRNGVAAVRRHGLELDVLEPSGEVVDLRRAMSRLPMVQRHVLVLVHVVGLDLNAAARELGVPLGTVKSRLARGRRALLPLLHDHEEVAVHGCP